MFLEMGICYDEENLTKDDARQQFLRILKPYDNSVFFLVGKIDDPIGLLPWKIDLGINKRGLHFFRPVRKEYLYSAYLTDIQWYEGSETDVSFKIRVAGVVHKFRFETKQGWDICFALHSHINDVMLEKNSKPQSSANGSVTGSVNGDVSSNNYRTPSSEFYRKVMRDLYRRIEEMQKNTDQTFEYIINKMQKIDALMQEEECLKDSLRSEKQNAVEELEKMKSSCEEKDLALQVALMEKSNLESRLAKLSSQGSESNIKKANNRTLNKIQDELKARTSELQKAVNEKVSLLEKISLLERKRNDEIETLQKNAEEERRAFRLQISDYEKGLQDATQKLADAQTCISDKDVELRTLQNRLGEMKEDIDRKNEQNASILKMLGAQIAEMEKTIERGTNATEETVLEHDQRAWSIVNDPSKNVSSEEVARLKKLLAHCEELAG